ncbi:MAG: hypothetical protein ISS10_01645 [Candidatus Marinimicrobia bacterium]|nr:hypothetical protein [Candidatus Neomarinimicrobiota bacterium]
MIKGTLNTIGLVILSVMILLTCEGPYFIVPREPDTTPPSATMISPADKATLSNDVLIEIHAEDDDGIDSVEIFIDEIIVSVVIDSPYTYIWSTLDTLFLEEDTLIAREDDYHSITSRTIDQSENHRYTDPILIWIDNIDNIPPTGELIDLYWGKTVSGIVPLVVEASDNKGIQSVTFIQDNTVLSVDQFEPYSFDWNTIELEDKYYTIRAVIEDLSENRTTVGPIQVMVDNLPNLDIIPPNVVITYPAAAQTVTDVIIIAVEATDNDAISHVEFYINGIFVITDSELPYSYLWNTLDPMLATEDAEHILHVIAVDISGNAASPSPISVVVDNTESEPPAVVITEPPAGQTVSGTVPIRVTATDNFAISHVDFIIDDELLYTDNTYPYRYDWNTMTTTDDTWQIIQVIAVDVNNISSNSNPVSVFVDNIDDIPPTGMILNPYAGQTVSGTVDIQVNANDNDGIYSVRFSINGVHVSTANQSPYEHSWDTHSALEDNNHIISILITDLSGNTTALEPIAVFVDNHPQDDVTPPNAVILNPISGQIVNGIVSIEVNASDNLGISTVEFSINQTFVHSDDIFPYEYEWNTVTWGENGEVIIQANVTDVSGNFTSSQPVLVTVDNIYHEIPEDIHVEITQPGIINIIWSSSVGAVYYRLYRNDIFLVQTDNTTYQDTNILPNTDYCYTVSAVNNFEIESDTTPPSCVEDLLPGPSNLIVAALSDNEINISWSAVTGAGSYRIDTFAEELLITVELTYTHSVLSDATTYCYTITALDLDGDPGLTSNEVCSTTHTTLIEPTLSLASDGSSIILSWTSVPTAVEYHIYRDDVFYSQTSSVEFTDSSVEQGTEFCYSVLAANEFGTEGPLSNEVCERIILPATTIEAEAVSTSSIIVSWSSVEGAISYILYRNGAIIDSDATSPYSDFGLDDGSQYCYIIHGVDSDGVSGETSNEVCSTTHTALIEPTLSVVSDGSSIILSWTSVPTAVEYHIYRDDVFYSQTSSVEFTDSSVEQGTEFCYSVLAANEFGTEGPLSNEVCERIAVPPPSDLTTTGGDQSVFLNWSVVDGAVSYNVYLSGSELRDLELLVNTNDTFYNHEGLEFETTYCYAVESVGIDEIENVVSTDVCSTTNPELVPFPPTSLTATQVDGDAHLNWTSSISDNVDVLLIYRNSQYFESVVADVESYTDTTVSNGIEYCYYLVARTANNTDSEPSNTECLTIE